ncbi:hypothetical protein ANN_00561 [Periplaneta americana]|uniref:Uncharacterized protein n=1 Tax=Periplaneta americana TaxID=6978 RepID=A0ABQ8TU24_PERAM|nr:hypothetical protein ANN_00561 [Periplaneta americana]
MASNSDSNEEVAVNNRKRGISNPFEYKRNKVKVSKSKGLEHTIYAVKTGHAKTVDCCHVMGDLILDCSADKCPLSIHSVFAMVQGAAVVLILAALLASPVAPGMVREEQYVAKFDNMYVGDIVTNDQVLDSYIRCFLDTGTCTVDGAQLKGQYKCDRIPRYHSEQGLLLRISRHHLIRSKIAAALRNKDRIVEEEISCLAENGSTRLVEILAYNADTKQGIIVDPTIRFEVGCHQSAEVHHEKKSIYEPIANYFKLKYTLIYVDHVGFLVGARRTIPAFFEEFRRQFALPTSLRVDIVITVLKRILSNPD